MARGSGSRQVAHPLQREWALRAGRNLIVGVWGTGDDAIGNGLRLRIVDRNVQVGEVTGAFLGGWNGDQRTVGATEAAQVVFVREEIGLVFRSPNERQV